MSETKTETVVVDDANAAHALIGRSIGGVELISFWAGSQTVFFCGPNGSAVGEFRKWGESVEVDALPPATMWVHLDDLPGNTLPGETQPVVGYGYDLVRGLEWTPKDGLGRGVSPDNWYPLTVVDHMVEVLAPVPVVEAPDEETVREAAEWLVAIYSPLDFTEPRIAEAWAGLVAALAADRGEA
jgi:hypothetical protein